MRYCLLIYFFVLLPLPSFAEEVESPWLIMPTFSSDPKVGTSLGGMAAYLYKFDSESPASMFGVAASYSNTDSKTGGIFSKAHFDQDRKRLMLFLGGGEIKNDYEDFLGTGLSASTTDDMKAAFVRYLQQVKGRWYIGGQAIYSNYIIAGNDWLTDQVLDLIGLTGFDSGALGLVGQYDDRDNTNSPTKGKQFTLHNFAYRESFGGEESFDTYNAEYKQFWSHGDGHVFGLHVSGRWTSDAPPGGYSSVNLRGYTRGQYLAPHHTTVEFEERYHIKGRFGATFFAGVACLYGSGDHCDESENLYPTLGAGLQFVIQQEEGMVLNMSYAQGEGGNSGFYLKFGQAF